jgi:hypothetical protein
VETALEALQKTQGNSNIIFLEYHCGGDEYQTAETSERMNTWYGAGSYPTTFQDGVNPQRVGGYSSGVYSSDYNSRRTAVSPLEMSLAFTKNGMTVNYDVTVKNTGSAAISNVSINFVAYEDLLTDRRHFVVRRILPYQTVASFPAGATQHFTASGDLPAGMGIVPANVHGVAFAQLRNSATKEILQAAGEPQPFSPPAGVFNPGWNWFSLPLIPNDPEASVVFQHNMSNIIYRWDNEIRTIQVYADDFQNLNANESYLLFLENQIYQPSYFGTAGPSPSLLNFTSAGWVWVGYPHTVSGPLRGVKVKNLTTGVVRTASTDQANANPWINWNWAYWDSVIRTARICALSGGDDTALRPWYGYRVWANVGNLQLQIP